MKLTLEEVKDLNQKYFELNEKEGYTNEKHIDIFSCTIDILQWSRMIGTEADMDTFGEFTRRTGYAFEELKELLKTES